MANLNAFNNTLAGRFGVPAAPRAPAMPVTGYGFAPATQRAPQQQMPYGSFAMPPQQQRPANIQSQAAQALAAAQQRAMQSPQMARSRSGATPAPNPYETYNPANTYGRLAQPSYLPNPAQFGAGLGGFSPFTPAAAPRMTLPQINPFSYQQRLPAWSAPNYPSYTPPSYTPPARSMPIFDTNLPVQNPQEPRAGGTPPVLAGPTRPGEPAPRSDNAAPMPIFDTNLPVQNPQELDLPRYGGRQLPSDTGPTRPGEPIYSIPRQDFVAGGIPGFAKGGRVRGYANGGLAAMASGYGLLPDYVTLDESELLGGTPSNFTGSGPGALESPVAAEASVQTAPVAAAPALPTAALPALAPATALARPDLASLYARYMNPTNPYATELREARAAAAKETDAFNQIIERALASTEDSKPSKEELYFRLAAAFGKPTRTGRFTESLGEASNVMAEASAAERKLARESRAEKLQLGLAAQKARMESAKSDLSSLRGLAAEEMKDQRALATKALEQYIASGKPQSDAGKAAVDMGLVPGTTDYQKYVDGYIKNKMENGNLFKEAMVQIAAGNLGVARTREERAAARERRAESTLTPLEVKMREEAEGNVEASSRAFEALSRAYELNPNTFTSSGPDVIQRKALELSGAPSKKLEDTRIMENLLGGQALDQLKTIFGAAPTEGERAILMDLQGVGAKSVKERAEIIKRAAQLVKQREARERRKLEEIRAGRYKTVAPTTETEAD